MHSLVGRENASDGGCLLVIGNLLTFTTISLLPLLFPDLSSVEWYGLFAATTDILLFSGLFLFIVPFSDMRAKYSLAFILLSCILLQISLYQSTFHWPGTEFLEADWSIRLRIGYVLFLVGLYLFTVIAHYQQYGRIRQNITGSSLAVSEKRVIIGKPFTIKYTLSSRGTISIERISVIFCYQQYVNREQQPYEERSLAVYQKENCISDPANPLVETFSWTIPAHLLPEDGTRKDWSLNVQLKMYNGITLRTVYPLKVIWLWPDKNE